MKISEVMTPDVRIANPEQTVEQAACLMAELDAVMIGMVTDRDIAVRCVAKGKGPETKVREVMSDEVKYYF